MPWRTEPEIDEEQQTYLADRRAVKPDIENGIYPFKGIKLRRADVEWLLATHNSGRGPVQWEEERTKPRERMRWGLDLRGADLRGVSLTYLPLTRLRAGLWFEEWPDDAQQEQEQSEDAAAHLEGADLSWSHLEGAMLHRVHLEGSNLRHAKLVGAYLTHTYLKQANLNRAVLDLARLSDAHLEEALLTNAYLQGASLGWEATAIGERIWVVHPGAHLAGAVLADAQLDSTTLLAEVSLYDDQCGGALVADVNWGGTNLATVDWAQVPLLGDEQLARGWTALHPYHVLMSSGEPSPQVTHLQLYERAVRANRQVATALRAQGLNEHADRFAYRAQVLQRQVLRRQGHPGRAFGSWLLDLVAGYGYKPVRSVVAYVLIIVIFAGLFLLNAQFAVPHLRWDEALVLSISSFHGRGFFSSGISLGDTLARLAAGEAIIGLLIEITFIATFTQRFFAR
jgi:uncharacterized protein YjbI with pentapeptide repeats